MTRSLCLTMIVRDEGLVLDRCLKSTSGLYDELVVVDTGSSDDTIGIAERHGAKVHRYAGANGPDGRILDFADARNVALQWVNCDWILQMDADEVLLGGHAMIEKMANELAADAILVRLRSEGSEWQSVRLFRRTAARRYVGRIHEYLEYEGATQSWDDVIIENLPDKTGKESAYARNVRIANAEIETGQGSSRVWHNLGNEHFRAGAFKQAAKSYDVSLKLGGYTMGRFHGSFYKASCHLLMGEFDAAISEVSRSIGINPGRAEAHCLLGDCHFIQDRFAEAAKSYRAALACKGRRPPSSFPSQPWMEEEHPTRQLALIACLI